jgi:CRISPR-associated endonuclease/helicase Cas3
MTYAQFFQESFHRAGRGRQVPYTYQCQLAGGDDGANSAPNGNFSHGTDCRSQLIDIPTGLGKTAGVVLAWLWNRVAQPNETARSRWPRRLVYCLPMRTLVEQTVEEVRKWFGDAAWDGNPLTRKGKVGIHILMGGTDAGEWDIYPEENAILIGTQDMLLSRALNRGYGMSRYRWPMHFGLLNNDSLWVMDETQLMGVGVETSAQLEGFRSHWNTSPIAPCATWWMSATLDDSRLATVDHPKPANSWPTLELSPAEKSGGRPSQLLTAPKSLMRSSLELSTTTKAEYAAKFATIIKEHHRPGTLTLVVVNRVSRARDIYTALTAAGKKGKQTLPSVYDPERVALIHSRFRPIDRDRHARLLLGDGDRIVIATQAIEAGVDVSARLLVTELAPWSSLVQRMGRCNRYAELPDAEVLWVNIEPKDEKDDLLLPYSHIEFEKARTALCTLTDAGSQTLRAIEVSEETVIRPVIRRRDLVDLFDTTPDICGQDLDVSRYIRDGEDNDVQFFWRDIAKSTVPTDDEPQPLREELCRVSIGDAVKFFKSDKVNAWRWNPLDMKWEPAKSARPGSVYLVAANSGGYDDCLGWTGDTKSQLTAIHHPTHEDSDSHDGNQSTFSGQWMTLEQHTADVVRETSAITTSLAFATDQVTPVHTAALWHDVGKAHPIFQEMLTRGNDVPADKKESLQAKSDRYRGHSLRDGKPCRGFRHELASSLAWLLQTPNNAPDRDLIAYLIAAHHGKVRMSIRSLPEEEGDPSDADRLFARGIWQGDILPAVRFKNLDIPETRLDLGFMRMGDGSQGPSWLARSIALRDRVGLFRLAFLETILRSADARASATMTTSQN